MTWEQLNAAVAVGDEATGWEVWAQACAHEDAYLQQPSAMPRIGIDFCCRRHLTLQVSSSGTGPSEL